MLSMVPPHPDKSGVSVCVVLSVVLACIVMVPAWYYVVCSQVVSATYCVCVEGLIEDVGNALVSFIMFKVLLC